MDTIFRTFCALVVVGWLVGSDALLQAKRRARAAFRSRETGIPRAGSCTIICIRIIVAAIDSPLVEIRTTAKGESRRARGRAEEAQGAQRHAECHPG